jgi:hypothetical protein
MYPLESLFIDFGDFIPRAVSFSTDIEVSVYINHKVMTPVLPRYYVHLPPHTA